MKQLTLILITLLFLSPQSHGQKNAGAGTQKVQVAGHAHMDPVYRWRWNEIENREIYNTFSNVLKMMDKYPELKFSQSSLLYYSAIQQRFPEVFDKVRQSIQDNRWSVVGGQWVEIDETMPSGESIIRQFLISKDYYSRNMGIDNVSIAWSPDAFTGHSGSLPKLYAGCGIKYYVFSRAAPEGKKIFWWESKDGTKMLGYKIPDHYNPTFSKMPEYIKEWTDISGYDSPMVTVGKGDHGGGPDEGDLQTLKNLSENHNMSFEFVNPYQFFEDLEGTDNKWPVQKEEFGIQPNGQQWLGCYTSHAKIKKLNRYYENRLLTAEKFSVIGTLHKGKPFFPREDFAEAWKILLFNQFHDIMAGTFTGLGAIDVYRDYERLEHITSEQLNAGLENIGARINIDMEGIPLVVYNPHSWPVSQYVEAEIEFIKKPTAFNIKDPSGKAVAYAIVDQSKDGLKVNILLDAQDVPPLGYRVYEVIEGEAEKSISDLKVEGNSVENSYYLIKWDEAGLSSIYSKELKKELLKGTGNSFQLLEDNGSSWSTKFTGETYSFETLVSPKIISQSPLSVTVKWEDYLESTKVIRTMSLNANSSQIDFEMEVDWHSHNKLLQVIFPTGIEKGKAFYDQQYGYVQRENSDLDYPAQKWIDYSNSKEGITLLNNGKYGFHINEGKMSMSVVRGARDMDPRMDEGVHTFKYALIAHKGDWRDDDIPQKAWQFNQPLLAKQENNHPGEISGWRFTDESFPLEKSFFSIDSDHVMISSVKTVQDAYNPYPLILRIVETEGRDEDITVKFPYKVASVIETNHVEDEIEPRSEVEIGEDQFSFRIGHDQVRTFMIRF
ncbi:MAG: glycoside hydrolase family 38 C-terminal domain-containing protein [Cyclobacteriaceae bacterium]